MILYNVSLSHTHIVCKVEPRGLIARRVTEVAQSTLDIVTTAVDYPLCEYDAFYVHILLYVHYTVHTPLLVCGNQLCPKYSECKVISLEQI